MRMINRSGRMDEFKALPVTSTYKMSTGRAGSVPDTKNLDALEVDANDKLI
jgi:hypothetical protein